MVFAAAARVTGSVFRPWAALGRSFRRMAARLAAFGLAAAVAAHAVAGVAAFFLIPVKALDFMPWHDADQARLVAADEVDLLEHVEDFFHKGPAAVQLTSQQGRRHGLPLGYVDISVVVDHAGQVLQVKPDDEIGVAAGLTQQIHHARVLKQPDLCLKPPQLLHGLLLSARPGAVFARYCIWDREGSIYFPFSYAVSASLSATKIHVISVYTGMQNKKRNKKTKRKDKTLRVTVRMYCSGYRQGNRHNDADGAKRPCIAYAVNSPICAGIFPVCPIYFAV